VGARERDLATPGLAPEALLVFRFQVVDGRLRRVLPDPIGVAEDEDDSDRQARDQDHQPADEALADRDAGDSRRDSGRERVDRRPDHPDTAAE
jgi:hypothetical protein